MSTMALKLLCKVCDLGYLKIGYIILNWRGKFLQAQEVFPKEFGLVDGLLENVLVEQELGELNLECVTDIY